MKQTIVPITSLILLDPIHANNPKNAITIGQGVFTKSFSNQIKKYKRGSKKPSIASPYARENSLKLKSIPFFSSLRASLFITGILVKKSINFFNRSNPFNNGFDNSLNYSAFFIFFAASLETHLLQTPSCVFRNSIAASAPSAWFSPIHTNIPFITGPG